jgi:hypothetical protein
MLPERQYPTFVIVSLEPENLLQKIGEMEEIEADIYRYQSRRKKEARECRQ